jgi:molybdenum cofactor biosynthesis protein B
MPGIDDKRPFVPLKIAVLTVSDTRELADDKSGGTLVERIEKAGHVVAGRSIVTDDVEKIREQVRNWIADKGVDVVISTGGTGFTGRDVTPRRSSRCSRSGWTGSRPRFTWSATPRSVRRRSSRAPPPGVAGSTFIFCLPGSPGACRDAWDEILVHQLDYRFRPCNFVELMPRLDENMRRAKAQGATA